MSNSKDQLDFRDDLMVVAKITQYPNHASQRLLELRTMIIDIAKASPHVAVLTETFKWNEPAYLSNVGSTVRINYKTKKPDAVSVFVNCNTSLIDEYRENYPTAFRYIGNREIELPNKNGVDNHALTEILTRALEYKVKL